MKVIGGAQHASTSRIVSVSDLHAQARKLVSFHAQGLSVQKQLHCVAVRVTHHGDELALTAFPVPMREQVQDRLYGPLALVEVEAVFFKAAGIENAGSGASRRPAGFAQI